MQIGDGMEFADSAQSPRTVLSLDSFSDVTKQEATKKSTRGEVRCSVVTVEPGHSRVLLRAASKDARLWRRRSACGRYLGTIVESGFTPPSSPVVPPRALDDDDHDSGLEASSSSDKFSLTTRRAARSVDGTAAKPMLSSPPDSPTACCLRVPLSLGDVAQIVEGRPAVGGPPSDAQPKDQEVCARPDLEQWCQGRYQEFMEYASRRDEPRTRARRRRIHI